MLVLSRKVGQRLVIDDSITIVINRIAGNRVQIGIEAPNDVQIMRGELDKIRREFSENEPTTAQDPAPVVAVAEFEPTSDVTLRSVQ